MNNKYFGTDGFRGEANVTLTSLQAYKVGRFLGWYFSNSLSKRGCSERARIVIGKDTRRSGYMLEYSIAAGICASGSDAYMLHVTTTPGVSFVTRQEEFDCGIMITASHNPYYDNGIKLLNRYGEKLDDKTTSLIEAYLDGDLEKAGANGEELPFAKREKIGAIIDYAAGRNRYVGYLISLASHSYKRLRIGLDSANGASHMIAKAVFDALGAETVTVGTSPDGLNINLECGSTHMERLKRLVKERHLDAGFAFDGDADRCLAVDSSGKIIDGDAIMYILAKRLKERGMLGGGSVVATVMSNSGFVKSLGEMGISTVTTKVGDRFVYEEMQRGDYTLGGEQSGHIILRKYATTGDGILTAIMLCEEMCDRKLPLAALTDGLSLYPQYLLNLQVRDKVSALSDEAVSESVREVQEEIGEDGRVLLRESGTEPLVRIMTEAKTAILAEKCAKKIADTIKARGHLI